MENYKRKKMEAYMTMEKTIIGDTEIKKHNFHQYKRPILIKNGDIKIVVSNKLSFSQEGFKYFLGYKIV